MNRIRIALLLFTQMTFGQLDYTIDNWYQGKEAAMVLTFDDWSIEHHQYVVPLLNEYNIEGTFYVNKHGQYTAFNNAILAGHEIGNHTASHGHLLDMDSLSQEEEIFSYNERLTNNVKVKPLTFAYPFGEGSRNTAAQHTLRVRLTKEFIGARGVDQIFYDKDPCLSYDFAKTEMDYFRLKISVPSRGINAFSERVSWVLNSGGMMTYMYHAVGGVGYDPVTAEEFEEQLDTLSKYSDRLWLTSLDKVLQYHRERKCAILEEISTPNFTSNSWVVSLSDTLNDTKFYHPLTVRLAIPATIHMVISVKQNSLPIPFTIVDEKLVVGVVPDKGELVIEID